MKNINFDSIDITGGFWKDFQSLNENKIIYSVYNINKETGRNDMLITEKVKNKEVKPHIYWDSDVAKWLEAVAYILKKKKDDFLEKEADRLIGLMCKNQAKDGYFNSYFQNFEIENRFTKRTEHELYCAGHIIEAGIAYYECTGKDDLLNLAIRYADLIYKLFYVEKSTAFKAPGHEEIELALYKLYKTTNEKKYLDLAKYFIDNRANETNYGWAGNVNTHYGQDHLPIREQKTAEGHSVRAVYLYCAMADIGAETNDKELLGACQSLFEDIYGKKMYITGGIGSLDYVESFAAPYYLPNKTAYSETCASIGLMMFCQRMGDIYENSIYHDVVERVLFNAYLSGVSLDGEKFFYRNVLDWDHTSCYCNPCLEEGKVPQLPVPQRQKSYPVICCPPNITRFAASVANYLYSYNENTVFINQFMENTLEKNLFGKDISIKCITDYPNNGKIQLKIQNMKGNRIAVRIPAWCNDYTVSVPGNSEKGYYYIDIDSNDISIDIDFKMDLSVVICNPKVQENAGKCAVTMGPVIYCAEGIDNGENLSNIYMEKNPSYEIEYNNFIKGNVIKISGKKIKDTLSPFISNISFEEKTIKLIPYRSFANRELTDMKIFFNLIEK